MSKRFNMLKYIRILMLGLVLALSGVTIGYAQEILPEKQAQSVASEIASNYKQWRAAGWTGKLKSEMLPMSVTVKTYMLRDSLTLISLRAPLIGEVGRVEIDSRSLTIINRLKKCYARIDFSQYGDLAEMLNSNLQDIMVGRVTIIGDGTLSKSNCKDASIYKIDDDRFLISAQLPYADVNYGYASDKTGRILEMMATQGKPYAADSPRGMESEAEEIDANFGVSVKYGNKDADAAISVMLKGRNYNASLEDVAVEWGVAGFDRVNLSKGYTRGSLKDIMRF